MLFYPEERIAIFIDGANLYSAARSLQFDIDYKRLLDESRRALDELTALLKLPAIYPFQRAGAACFAKPPRGD